MDVENKTQDVLELLKIDKEKVNLQINNNIKSDNYDCISNTLYVSSNKMKVRKGLEETNPFCLKLLSICKECVKIKQSKVLHITNTVLTNISMVVAFMTILFRLVAVKAIAMNLFAIFILLLLVGLKYLINSNAYKRAIVIAKKDIAKQKYYGLTKENVEKVDEIVKNNAFKFFASYFYKELTLLAILLILCI